jgi:APA family basic amino acid/polyamine antiporter
VGLGLFLGTLLVSVMIYIVANVMYLAVVPLLCATAESDRVGCGGFANYFWVGRNFNYCRDDHDFDFACNNGLIMAGARVYYTMAQDGVFFKKSSFIKQSEVYQCGLFGRNASGLRLCV